MYDKAGTVLRVETVINNPEGFRVRKSVRRRGEAVSHLDHVVGRRDQVIRREEDLESVTRTDEQTMNR